MKDSGIDVGSALALSFPFAVAFQFVITATYTFATTLTSFAYKALDKKDFRGFRIAANATVCVFAVVGFIIGFGGAFSSDGLSKVISLIPRIRTGLIATASSISILITLLFRGPNRNTDKGMESQKSASILISGLILCIFSSMALIRSGHSS